MIFPRLENEKILCIDIETHDPSIGAGLGPGPRRDGYILGVGIATIDKQWYFPLDHKNFEQTNFFEGEYEYFENVNKDNFYAWLKSLKHVPFLGQNITYDVDYLQYQGFIPDRMHDTIIAEPLLDENRKSYSLENLAIDYLNEHKAVDEMKGWCKSKKLKGNPQEHLVEMPTSLVDYYCRGDVRQTMAIWQKQMPKIKEEGLEKVYTLECELLHVLLYMRKLGVRVDEEKIDQLRNIYTKKSESIGNELKDICGFEINVNQSASIKQAFDKFGLSYIVTEKDNPSFDKAQLLKNGSTMGEMILEKRHCDKMLSTYIDGIAKYIINGRVHTEFNPLRNMEKKGTVIGRFSSSKPNLQNIRRGEKEESYSEEEYEELDGDIIRSIFIPEEGKKWAKLDYSQEEIAIFFHFSEGQGASQLRKSYVDNPKIDTYKIIAGVYYGKKPELVTKEERSKFKTQTLGLMYGMSAEKLGRNMGLITLEKPLGKDVSKMYWDKVFKSKGTWEQKMKAGYDAVDMEDYPYLEQYVSAWKKMNAINKKLPCLKGTTKAAQDYANANGYIRTITGRKRRFDSEQYTYKAFQAKDSGTAADIMKIVMCEAYRAGIQNRLNIHLTVHDELDVSYEDNENGIKALRELKSIMEKTVRLSIPLRVEIETGPSWGELKKECI
jgi:DNA polymerase-1